MKKITNVIFASLLAMSMVGCSSSKATQTVITKSAKGFGGDVSVTVTFEGDKIVDVKAEGKDETEAIGGKALESLPGEIVKANSADVDVMSGATFTSNAIITATKAAIAEAKGESATSVSYTAGTYTGSAYGNTSTITVDVTVSDSAIEKIDLVSQNETPILFDAAWDTVTSEIVDEQSLAVDTVSGASTSSNGIIAAVDNALTNAGVDTSSLKVAKEKEPVQPQEITKEADVVVVGGGGAGLVAAISAAEKGSTVLVVEKAPFLGGNLSVFGGIYNTPDEKLQSVVEMSDSAKKNLEDTINAEPVSEEHKELMDEVKAEYEEWKANGSVGLFDSPEWFALQTWNSGDKVANLTLVREMCENAYDGYEWLVNLGVEFADKVTQGAGSLYQRTHGAIKPNGSGFINAYTNTLAKYDNVEIITKTEAKHFIMDGNKCVGIEAEDTDGNTYTIHANNGVVLATGGFAGNVELRQKYCEGEKWKDLGPSVMTTNLKAITGDGIIMAEEIGADFVDMDQLQLLHLGNPFTGSTKGVIPYKGRNSDEVIFVNAEGNRFVREDGRRDVMCNAITQQTGGYYWMIHDSQNIDPYADSVEEYIKGGYLYRADTLEELADMIGIPADALVETVNKYNSYVDNGEDPETGRTLLVSKITDGPFFAAKRVPSAHHTMGGVHIDTETHVLDKEQNIIEGLYAAGEVTGGIHGGNRVGGNAVDDTVVFGRIAGANAADNK